MIIYRRLRDQYGKAREAKETVDYLNVIFYNISCLAKRKKIKGSCYHLYTSFQNGLFCYLDAVLFQIATLQHYGTVINVILCLIPGTALQSSAVDCKAVVVLRIYRSYVVCNVEGTCELRFYSFS